MVVRLMYLQPAVCAFAAVLLLTKGIARSYRWLIIYLLVQAALGVPAALLYSDRNAYGPFYYYSVVFYLLPAMAAAIEGYSHVMHNHPGIERLGRRVLYGALAVATAVSAFTVLVYVPSNGEVSELFRIGSSMERLLRTALLVFWSLLLLFIIWYPVSLSRNTVILSITFATYFFGTAAATLAYTIAASFGVMRSSVGFWRTVFVLLCQIAWGLLLTRAGETKMVRIGHRWNPAQEAKLLAQLDAINEHLLSTSRVR